MGAHALCLKLPLVDEVADFREGAFAHLDAEEAGAVGYLEFAFEILDGGEAQIGFLPKHAHQSGAIGGEGKVSGHAA